MEGAGEGTKSCRAARAGLSEGRQSTVQQIDSDRSSLAESQAAARSQSPKPKAAPKGTAQISSSAQGYAKGGNAKGGNGEGDAEGLARKGLLVVEEAPGI